MREGGERLPTEGLGRLLHWGLLSTSFLFCSQTTGMDGLLPEGQGLGVFFIPKPRGMGPNTRQVAVQLMNG